MRNLTIHSTDTAPKASRELLVGIEQKFGFVPNVLRQMAESPEALNGFMAVMSLLEESSLSKEEHWITLLVTSSQNCANYCVAANSTIAQMLGVSPGIVQAIRQGEPLADSKLEALRVFATETVRSRGATSAETIRSFKEAGYTDAQLLDVILAIGLETIAGSTALAANTPVDEPFQANSWSQSDAA